MENRTSNQVSMIGSTLTFCTNNPAATAGIGAFAGVKTTADNKLVLIGQLGLIADGTTSGVTINTKAVRTAMCEIALKVGNAVSAYAHSIGDSDLEAAVTFTMPILDRMKKTEVKNACQRIHDEGNTHIAAAGAYGYVAADVTDLQTAINLYFTDWQNPRNAVAAKKDAIVAIKTLVREIIDDCFKGQMDKMVKTIVTTNPSFVNQYFINREILDLGSTTAKIRGSVRTENGELPLSNVKFTVYETGTTNIVKQVITDAEGKFNANQLPVGDYDLKWELHGYQSQTETNVHVAAGKELKRNIFLEEGGLTVTITGSVATGNIRNIQVEDLNVTSQSTMRLSVVGSTLRFYAAASNVAGPGVDFFEVADGEIYNKTVLEWATLFGFDTELEDFLNVINVGAAEGHWEMKFENVGA